MAVVLSIQMTMVNELYNQRVIARGHAHIATLRRLRKKDVPRTIIPSIRSGSKFDTSSDGDAGYAVALCRMQGVISRYRGIKVLLPALWHRLCVLCGRLRPTAVVALGIAVALIPTSLVIASSWPQEPLEIARSGEVKTLLYRDLVAVGPASQDSHLARNIPSLVVRSYRVQAGDTISEIAHNFDINLDTLISFNGIRHVGDLRAGMELSIPTTSGLAYLVKSGDTLSGIAARHSIRMTDILDWNDLQSSTIMVGQKMFLPGASLSENERNAVLGRLFIKPTHGRITSPYGYRPDPFTGIRRFHNGIDIAAPIGTPIIASMGGRVGRVGVNGSYGRYVILVHADGYQTLYAHLSRSHVSSGMFVAQGYIIGLMGSTGHSTGSHLHFSIFKSGKHLDPSGYIH